MARKSRPQDQKLRARSPHTCPHCGRAFNNEGPDDQRRITLHRIMHVDNSSERWKLMDDWIAAKEIADAPPTGARTQAG